MVKFTKQVQEKVDRYKQEAEAAHGSKAALQEKVEEQQATIAELESKLAKVVKESDVDVSDEEIALRKEIAGAKLRLTAYQDRVQVNKGFESRGLAIDVIKAAKGAASEKYEKEAPVKLKAIEDAKIAYLQALAEFSKLEQYTKDTVFKAAQQTNPNVLEAVGTLTLPEIAWNYRPSVDSDGNKYTVFADEISHAVEQREVKRFSRS